MVGIAAVNVKTEKEYNQFMELLEENTDLNWMGGEKPTSLSIWYTLEDGTCIFRYEFGSKDALTCKYLDNAVYMGYQIISFSDLMNEDGK